MINMAPKKTIMHDQIKLIIEGDDYENLSGIIKNAFLMDHTVTEHKHAAIGSVLNTDQGPIGAAIVYGLLGMNHECAWVIDNLEKIIYLDRTKLDSLLKRKESWSYPNERCYNLEKDTSISTHVPSKSITDVIVPNGTHLTKTLKKPTLYSISRTPIYEVSFGNKDVYAEIGIHDACFVLKMEIIGKKREYKLQIYNHFSGAINKKQREYIIDNVLQSGHKWLGCTWSGCCLNRK